MRSSNASAAAGVVPLYKARRRLSSVHPVAGAAATLENLLRRLTSVLQRQFPSDQEVQEESME
jgi:hypothetical protein